MDFLLSLLPQEFSTEASLILTFLTLVIYFVESFLGYKLIRSWISVLGFLIGAVTGFSVVKMITDQIGYAVLGAVICGIVLAVLSYRVYLIGVFLIAAFGVFQIAYTFLPLQTEILTIASAILGLAAAYLAVKYMRPAIIAITAFHGGIMAGRYLPLFLTLPAGINALTLGLILGAAGTLVQFLTTKD